ncbi:MAG: hypothetical protein C4321_05790 [Chloroflexota bacterium]
MRWEMVKLADLRRAPLDYLGSTGDPVEDRETAEQVIAAIETLIEAGISEDDAIAIVLPDGTDLFAVDAILADNPWIPTHWLVGETPWGAYLSKPVMLVIEPGKKGGVCYSAEEWVGALPADWEYAPDGVLEFQGSRVHRCRLIPIAGMTDADQGSSLAR